MRWICCFFALLLFMSNCGNQNRQIEQTKIGRRIDIPIIHPLISESIDELINIGEAQSPMAVFFTDSLGYHEIIRTDSGVFVSSYDIKSDYSPEYYRGVIELNDTLAVAIFDRNNVGLSFYDRSQIATTSLTELKRTDLKPVIIEVIALKNDSLIRWIGH